MTELRSRQGRFEKSLSGRNYRQPAGTKCLQFKAIKGCVEHEKSVKKYVNAPARLSSHRDPSEHTWQTIRGLL